MVERFPERKEFVDQAVDPNFVDTDAWYRHLFSIAPSGMTKGECTPLYCALSEDGVNHGKALLPEVRLIYLVA